MITGTRRSYDFRFGSEFVDFLNSVNRSSVTYKIEPVEVDRELQEIPDIRFNLQQSVDNMLMHWQTIIRHPVTKSNRLWTNQSHVKMDKGHEKTLLQEG